MQIASHHLEGYFRLRRDPASQGFDEALVKLRASFEGSPEWKKRRFVHVSEEGAVVAGLVLADLSPTTLQLGTLHTKDGAEVDAKIAGLVDEAMAQVIAEGMPKVGSRIPVQKLSSEYRNVLQRNGFVCDGERIEFKTPLSELSGDEGSPIVWRGATSETLGEAAALLARCAVGDPDGLADDEDPREVINGYFEELDLTQDPEQCLHLGSLKGNDVAFVCAQTAEDGWSRISYMGLIPEARGAGLGHWVHRHGLSMLKHQGGTLYHGGTRTNNSAMLACFARQGCKTHSHLSEWSWRKV